MNESEWARYERGHAARMRDRGREYAERLRDARATAREARLTEAAGLGRRPQRPPVAALVGGGIGFLVLARLLLGGGSPAGASATGRAPAQPATATPAASAARAPTTGGGSGGTLTVTTKGRQPAVLRAAAGKGAARVALVPAGTIVQVSSSTDVADDTWYQVQVPDGKAGWMHGEVLA